MKRYYLIIGLICLVAVGAVTASYWLRRGPVADRQLAEDIGVAAQAVDTYYLGAKKLPASLRDVQLSGTIKNRLRTIEYRPLDDKRYELCGTFLTSQPGVNGPSGPYASPDPNRHSTGRQCFTYTQTANF